MTHYYKIDHKRFLIIALLAGILIGSAVFTFHYAEGLSYLSTDPKACANCHIMQSQLDSWQKSSHHTIATCVDCHLPTDFIGKYIAKADNGYRHSVAFTLQNFYEPIQIKEHNSRILQNNCLRCHQDLVHTLSVSLGSSREQVPCVHCHPSVGHGEYLGLGKERF